MLVTDRKICGAERLPEVVRQAVEAGVSVVQIREKDLSAAEQLELGFHLRTAVGGRALLIVNDRVDVAAALNADGVQLPESGLSVEATRRILGPGRLIGRSVHSLDGALQAEQEGADYLVFGSVYPSSSHVGVPAAGTQLLREVTRAVSVPVLAIGGITEENACEVLAAGAAGAAVISAVMASPAPKKAAAGLVTALQ